MPHAPNNEYCWCVKLSNIRGMEYRIPDDRYKRSKVELSGQALRMFISSQSPIINFLHCWRRRWRSRKTFASAWSFLKHQLDPELTKSTPYGVVRYHFLASTYPLNSEAAALYPDNLPTRPLCEASWFPNLLQPGVFRSYQVCLSLNPSTHCGAPCSMQPHNDHSICNS